MAKPKPAYLVASSYMRKGTARWNPTVEQRTR